MQMLISRVQSYIAENARVAQNDKIQMFIQNLKKQNDLLTEFDDALCVNMVEFITIGMDSRTVTFKDGTEITV